MATVKFFTITNDRGKSRGVYCTMRETAENPNMDRIGGLQTFRFADDPKNTEYDVLDWLAIMDGDF